MARKKRVAGMDGTTLLLIAGGAAVLLFFVTRPTAPAPTIIRTVPAGSPSTALTTAEITAGAGVVSNLIDDLTSNSDS